MLASLSLANAQPQNAMLGIWYSTGQPFDPNVVSLTDFRADGTFTAEFRKYDGCRVTFDQRESGTWTTGAGSKRMITLKVNGQPAYFDDEYKIEQLTDAEQRIYSAKLNYVFVEQRVQKFQFPACYYGV